MNSVIYFFKDERAGHFFCGFCEPHHSEWLEGVSDPVSAFRAAVEKHVKPAGHDARQFAAEVCTVTTRQTLGGL